MDSVIKVYQNNLCCSCGICEGICPDNALKLIIDKYGFYMPVIDKNKCKNCGLCLKYCTGNEYIDEIHRKEDHLYGYSTDIELRKNSSSGGLVTSLILYMIKRSIIDYAVVTKNRRNLKEPEVVLTNDPSEILESATSKYCPVPVGKILREIKKTEGKCVIVGLPCHIQGIYKYMQHNSEINKKVKYLFSLFCNHAPSFKATDCLIFNLRIKNVKNIVYRGNGWPGFIQIETNKTTCFLPFRETMKFSGFMKYFKNLRCLICDDPFGKFADISFGDAYFLTNEENGDGNTFLIVRNSEIFKVLRSMERDNEIALFKDIKERDIDKSFKTLFDRIRKVPKIIYVLKLIKKKTPINSPSLNESISLREVLSIIRNLIRINFGKYPFVWKRIFKKSGGNILFKKALFKKK